MGNKKDLEIVADVIGLNHESVHSKKGLKIKQPSNYNPSWFKWWNPKLSNNDAMDLAMKLGICIHPDVFLNGEPATETFIAKSNHSCIEKHERNPEAATRLAIFNTALNHIKGKNDE